MLLAAVALLILRPWEDASRADGGARAAVATVTRVVDGDTIEAQIDGRSEDVRYIGVDTPETVKPDTPVQCYGPQASAFNHRLVEGRQVRLVFGVERRDVYGRLLAYVYNATDGTFVNLALAQGGFADVLAIPPNTAHGDELRAAVADAKDAGRGLWGRCRSFGQPVGSSP